MLTTEHRLIEYPRVFEMDGGQAVAKVPAAAEDACRETARACPAEAINTDEDGAY
jgi:ferredoxin